MSGEDGGDGGSANGEGGVTATLFTQEQVNHFAAQAKRGAVDSLFRELGFDKPLTGDELKQKLTEAGEYQKLKQGQQGDMERLTGQVTELTEKANKVPTLEAQLLQAKIANDAGLKSRYWKFVEGSTEDEVKASVKAIQDDLGIGGSGDAGADNGSDQGKPGPQGTGALKPNLQQGSNSGGGKTTKTMAAGADAYAARHPKK